MQTIPAAPLCIALAAGLWHAAAGTQAIYRCGDHYGQTPCDGGTPLVLQDTRTPAQQEQARAAAARIGLQAGRLEKERRALERQAPRSAAVVGKPPPRAPSGAASRAQPPKAGKKEAPEHFTAKSLEPKAPARQPARQPASDTPR